MKLLLLVGCIITFGFTYLIQSEMGINWEPKREAVIMKMKEMFIYYKQYQNFEVAIEKQNFVHAYIQLLIEKPEEFMDAHQLSSLINYFEIKFLEIHNKYIDNQIPNDKYQAAQWYFDYQYYLKFIYWPIAFVLGLFLINLIYYCVADNCLKIKRDNQLYLSLISMFIFYPKIKENQSISQLNRGTNNYFLQNAHKFSFQLNQQKIDCFVYQFMLQLSMQIRNSKVETRKSYQQKKFQLKSSTIKKILFLLYFVGIFQLENQQIIVDLMNISLLIIQIWRHNTKIQISNIDRFDLTICFCALISRQTIPQLQSIILSLCFFSFKNNLSTILKSVNLLKKIKNLSITIIFIILLTSYLFTYLYHSYEQTFSLFGTFSNTCITMLEILTLDSWGSRGRILEQQVGYTGIPSIIICAYVFLMNYFYMNILIGLILETLQLEQNQQLVQVNFLDEHEMKELKINKKLSDNTHMCNLMLGQFYQQIVMVFSIVSVIFNIYNNFVIVDTMGKMFDALDDILYSIHFIFLLFLDKPRIQYERSKWERMFLHFIAGPLALFLSHDLACLCNLCKLATTPIVRGIFSGTISIFPILFPIITVLLAIILLMAVYTSRFYSSFIGFKGETYYTSLQQAFYTFVQLLTLDDWDANVLPVFESQQIILPYILFPCFIIISNVILLNILIACSCKYFKEIDYSINCQSLNEARHDNLLVKLNKVAELQIPIINCNTPNTIQESHISQREGLVQICYNNKIINALLVK